MSPSAVFPEKQSTGSVPKTMLLFHHLRRFSHLFLFLLISGNPALTSAQESDAPKPSESSQEAVAEESSPQKELEQELTEALSQIAKYRETLQRLNAQRSKLEGIRQEVLDARISRTLDQLISLSQATTKKFLSNQEEYPGLDVLKEQIVEAMASIPSLIGTELANNRAGIVLPRLDQTALEQAGVLAELEIASRKYDELLEALSQSNKLAAELGIDTAPVEADIRRQIIRGAEGASAYLDVTMDHLARLRRQLATLPKNEELKAKIAVTERHTLAVADILRKRAKKMASTGIDVSWIETQLIAATGALTTEIFNWNVVTGLAGQFFEGIVDWISDNGARIVFQILVFLAILAIAWKLARLAQIVTQRALRTTRVRLSQLLQDMIVSTARSIVLVLGLLIGLSQLGVSLGPLLAGLGIAGFIVGFALQDSLSNFASGMMILIYRPFDVGDVVDVNGAFGTVREMSLVNTTVMTYDNQTLVVPNNQIWQNVIKNLTNQTTRRVDMTFGISYGDDIEKAERVLREIVTSNDKVLEDPEPLIHVHELGDSSVNFIVRPWVRTEDYWDTYWTITREVKMRFDAEGISIPFPQRDVHLYTQTQSDT
ncbi:MAG: mechanosensitive ion channel [Betaproteobacteria bacterium]|nr:MAG: mechanosensitive ion channel [Betaproteobacteria bacterium]